MYRFIDSVGQEHRLSGADQLFEAVRLGRITPETLIRPASEGRWMAARELAAFQVAVAALDPNKGGDDRPTSTRLDPTPENQATQGDIEAVAASVSGAAGVGSTPTPGAGRPKKHRWQGVLYYWLCYIGAVLWGIGAIGLSVLLLQEAEHGGVVFLLFLFLTGIAVGSYLLGRGIERFEPWARVVALILAYIAVFGGLASCVAGTEDPENFGAFLAGVLNLIFVFYFHSMAPSFTPGDRGP